PRMFSPFGTTAIRAPLKEPLFLAKDPNQAKWQHSVELDPRELAVGVVRIRLPDQLRDQETTGLRLFRQSLPIGVVPIEQSQKNSPAVAGDPCSTGRFTRVNRLHSGALERLGWACHWPCQQFVAVHAHEITISGRNKTQSTHALVRQGIF